jgi:hypothetical protein
VVFNVMKIDGQLPFCLYKASSAPAPHDGCRLSRTISEPAERSGMSTLLVCSRRAGVGWWRAGAFIA